MLCPRFVRGCPRLSAALRAIVSVCPLGMFRSLLVVHGCPRMGNASKKEKKEGAGCPRLSAAVM